MSVKMKQSGIEWIGEIPEHWDLVKGKYLFTNIKEIVGKDSYRFKRLALTLNGIIERDKESSDGLQPINFDTYQIVRENNLIFKLIDLQNISTSRVGLTWSDGIMSSAYIRLVPVKNISIKFYENFYLMMWYYNIFNNLGDAGVRSNLNATDLLNIQIPYPPIEEQRLIAVQLNQICGTLDNTKADIEKQIEILNEYKKSVMLETFEFYCNKYSYNNVKINNLSKLVTKQTGFDYSTYISPALLDTKEENTLPFLQTKNFKSNYFNLNTDYYIPKEVAYRFNKILLNKKSLLFSIVGASIGNVAVYPGKEEAFLGGAICKVDLINEELYDYIKYYMLSPKGQDQILVKVNSNAQGTITVQNVRDFKVPIFKDSINRRIVAYLDSKCSEIDSIIETKKQQLELLEEYKKSIIYEYVTGKREVSAPIDEVTAPIDEVSAKPDFAVAQNTQSVSIE